MKRPTTTPRMKVDCLLHRFWMQTGTHLKCSISGEDLKPGCDIEFDHVHCLALDGPNEYMNLRPVLNEGHKKKSARDVKSKRKADRIAKGGKTIKHPMRKAPKRKWPSRSFPYKVS